MMDVLLKEIEEYLCDSGYQCIEIDNPDGKYLFVDININGNDIRLKCVFTHAFPYGFPKISILQEFYSKYGHLPHVDNDGVICTFDTNKVYPNFNKPKEVVLECIKKSERILLDGINGDNKEDFEEEFKAYWELESEIIGEVIFEPDDKDKILYCYRSKNRFVYLADDEKKLKNYLKYAHIADVRKVKITKALYLPLKNNWCYPPFPQNNKDIMELLAEEKILNVYLEYLKKYNDEHIIIFSQVINNEMCLAGWRHKRGNAVKGFRGINIFPKYLYYNVNGSQKIEKISVNQLNHARIYERGGDGNIKPKSLISVVGCGSIGSYLIKNLVDLGINNFKLIDKETLSTDNIARHYCGAINIGICKVDAIKSELITHYPDMNCECIKQDVFSVIKDEIEIFNQCDYNFIVVGNVPIEAKFMELLKNGDIVKPTIIIWVEPYIIGAHAIIIQKRQDLFNLLYDENYNFKENILLDGEKYIKREAGCQSTFLPYSAFEVQQCLSDILDYVNQNIFERGKKENFLLTWTGRIDLARKRHMKISDKWIGSENRKLEIRRLN